MARKPKPAPTPAASPPVPTPKRPGLKIGHNARIRAMEHTPKRTGVAPDEIFQLPVFPPNVLANVPKADRMAMDDFGGCYPWAGAQLAGGYYTTGGTTFFGFPILAEMSQRPEYRRAVESLATEMTRKWIKLQSVSENAASKKRIKVIEDALKRMRVRQAFKKLAELDGYFGRGHLFIDIGDNVDDRKELKTNIGDGRSTASKRKCGSKALKGFKTVEPTWTYPSMYNANDPLKDGWYKPGTWFVMGKEVHSSRLLTLVSREVPDLLKPVYAFGGLPLIQIMQPYVDRWLKTVNGVNAIINAFSIFVLMTNLEETLQADGDQMFARADLFNQVRDNRNLMMVDKETEDFKNVTASLSSLDLLQAQSQEHCASIAGLPLVKYTGLQPAGLNASADGEIRIFYDWINACQEDFFRSPLTTAIDFIQLSECGDVDPDITFAFEPLWSLDEKALAEKRKTEADTDAVLIESAVISEEEVRERLVKDPTSPYSGIDPADVPEKPMEETGQPFNARKTVGEGSEDE